MITPLASVRITQGEPTQAFLGPVDQMQVCVSACVYAQDREAMIESLNYNATLDYFSMENNKVTIGKLYCGPTPEEIVDRKIGLFYLVVSFRFTILSFMFWLIFFFFFFCLLPAVPAPPHSVMAIRDTDTSVLLQWQEPKDKNGILGYYLYYSEAGKHNWKTINNKPFAKTRYVGKMLV